MTKTYSFSPERDDYFSDSRSTGEEEFYLNLRIKMDKRHLDELASFFGEVKNGEYPKSVKQLLGGRYAYDVYMANASGDGHLKSINIVIATDTPNKNNIRLFEELDNMTLSFYGYNTPDYFCVTGIRKIPGIIARVSNRVFKAEIVFFYNHSTQADNIGDEILEKIFSLPDIFDGTKLINQRITHWDEYLKINENFAAESQLLFDYSDTLESKNISQLVFRAETDQITEKHVNSDIQLVQGIEKEYGTPVIKGPVIGNLASYDSKNGLLTVNVDFEFMEHLKDGTAKIPRDGKLFITKWGDLVQIRRLRYGLNTFARGQAQNPMLDVFIFDASKARECEGEWETVSREDLFHKSLNEEQLSAVEGVINSPDMYLIQGPPGTGKTTVISEICYQNAIRGKKTLIASQTNLAVDNALGKLVNHPKIRALRKGNEQSVQEEGKHFTENNVILTWIEKTASGCRDMLTGKSEDLSKAQEATGRLDEICEKYSLWREAKKKETDSAIRKAKYERLEGQTGEKINWLCENGNRFLKDVRGESYINLLENPYGFEEEFIDTVKSFHATKIIMQDKQHRLNQELESIKETVRKIQAEVDFLTETAEKALKRNVDSPGVRSDQKDSPVSYDAWCKEAESVKRRISELSASKPGNFFLKVGFGKKWSEGVFSEVREFYSFKALSRRAILGVNIAIDETVADPELPRLFKKFKALVDNSLSAFNEELVQIREELECARKDFSENKSEVKTLIEEIGEYNHSLPYSVRCKDIEEVSLMSDIKGYYTGLWEKKYSDDKKLYNFISEWIKRLETSDKKDFEAFKRQYIKNANVIGITCSQSGSREFTSQYPTFDVAIIDEVSKATPPELILSVLKAKKIVLVGDHKQLPPMVGSDTYEEVAAKLNIDSVKTEHMKTSLFEELFVNAPASLKTMLSTQYRMHPKIMETINQFYIDENGYGLKCGLTSPDTARAHSCHGGKIAEKDHVIWVDVPLFEENAEKRSPVNHSYSNPAEVKCIKNILLTLNRNLTENNFEGKKKIGIISFYSNQVRLMENEFYNSEFQKQTDKLALRIGSVDRFQGIECPVVICSFVRNNTRGEIGFAKDPRRVNVALSRAQELSVIVGCSELFCSANKDSQASSVYETISKHIYSYGGEKSEWDFV